MSDAPFDGWSPVRVFRDPADGWVVEWCRMGHERFDDPCFAETIDRALGRPFNRLFRRRTRLEDLGTALGGANAVRPAGLIFHLSRCGSTLVAQTLAHGRDRALTDEWRVERLRWIVTALGRSVSGEPGRFVLKLDAWHALDAALIHRAFPDVPSIVLYRDPVEVLVSHECMPGWMMQLGLAERLLGEAAGEAMTLPRTEYAARILERFLRAMLSDDDPACRLVNYTELPGAAVESIPRWFGIDPGNEGRRMMAEAARRDAKHPQRQHIPDSVEKQRRAGAGIRAAAAARLLPVYEALEARRRRQPPVSASDRPQNSETTIP